MTAITKISCWAGILGACLLAATGAMLTYEVVARYFFIKPTIWAAELSQLCLIWGCLLAMAWVLSKRHHITVNAVTNLLPIQIQKVLVTLSLLIILIFSGIVTIWGWEIFYDSFSRGRTTGSLLNLQSWIAELSVPVGFALTFAQALSELLTIRKSGLTTLGSGGE
ncbi:TRAP transporter small permease [Pseudopelagicola sp. nBUS_19]|uniref:TRAP transporter small permease n=1 Tax=Pseudopelagicola sp. nBUS_19 TaxID=3395316 RepID=UPI003EBCE370